MPDFKLLPMGIADFRRIRRENYYYVDKTAWIPKFEQVSSFLFFCRPRRFGKTLMMDDLTSGYNIATNITTRYNFNQVLGFSEPWRAAAGHPQQQRAPTVLRLPVG